MGVVLYSGLVFGIVLRKPRPDRKNRKTGPPSSNRLAPRGEPPDFGQEEVSAEGDFLEVDVDDGVGDGPNIFLSKKFVQTTSDEMTT